MKAANVTTLALEGGGLKVNALLQDWIGLYTFRESSWEWQPGSQVSPRPRAKKLQIEVNLVLLTLEATSILLEEVMDEHNPTT